VRLLSPEETHPYDPEDRAFWNVNTPEDLAEAEGMAKGTSMPGLGGDAG